MNGDPYLPYVSRLPLSFPDDAPVHREIDGTLVFVDVAGFTALSERLSRTGRAGAEEVTDLLGGAFARLLAAAYEDGGSLLSFGGDALLLFFSETDHRRRAAHAAGVIRTKPKEIGPLQTSVGAVRLKLSMGAHSGRFHFCVVGDRSLVPLVMGPDVTATVRLEQRAHGGQVLLGQTLAAAVPEACGPVDDGAALLLRTPRPPLVGDPEPAGAPSTRPERFLSPALREHVAAHPGSEHRRVAVGFVQVRGTDALFVQDATRATQLLHEVTVRAQTAAEEYGVCLLGSDVDADGAKLILVAGAPRATEDEEERLLRTCRAVLDLDTPLQLRSGVAAGSVFVGDVGPPYRRTYTAMGDRVNLAARLMASAAPGELRTTPAVLAASRSVFATTILEPLVLKGIAEPVAAVAVGAPMDRTTVQRSHRLLGRDPELAVLSTALDRACQGTGSVVEVVGGPGTGKSALLSELVATADVPSLRVAAAPYESQTPLGLLKRFLRQLMGVDAEAPGADVEARARELMHALSPQELSHVLVAADALPAGAPAPADDELFLPRLSRAVRRAIEALVPGPGLLVVEDVHAADPSSLAVIRGVASQQHVHPWLLCLSRRGEGERVVDDAELVELGALDEQAATDLVHALTADRPMTSSRVAAVVARSAGNPLFLTQLLKATGDDLPDSVEAVVNARLDALPSYLRKLVRQAAVLGVVLDLDLLAELAGFVPDRHEWRELDGVLARQGSRAEFVSEVFRDVAYLALPYRDRREMHRLAGRALERRGTTDVELLAFHAAQAHDNELTWRFAVEAGRRAQARGAHDLAALSFRRALIAHDRGHLDDPAATGPVQAWLGDALASAGRPLEAIAAYRRARALCPRGPDGDPDLLLREGLVRLNQGRHVAAARWLRRGLDAVRDGDTEVELELLNWYAGNSLRQGRYPQAVTTLEGLLRRTGLEGHPEPVARAHYLLHLIFTTLGDPRRAEHRTQALPVYEASGNLSRQASILNNLGMDAYYEGRWTDAVELFERSRVCEEHDANDVGAAVSEANIAEVLSDQGYLDEAEHRLERAMRTFRGADFPMGTATALYHLGRLETRRGRLEQARARLDEALTSVLEMHAQSLLPDVVVRLAELEVMGGGLAEAERLLDQLAQLPDVGAEMSMLSARLRAAIAATRGDDDVAEQLLRGTVAAERAAGTYSAALARHSLAVLLHSQGRPEAELHQHASIEVLRAMGVHQFLDPLTGPDLVVISLPTRVLTLTDQPATAAAV